MRLRIRNTKGHIEAWESITSTQRATRKSDSPCPRVERPRQSMSVRIRNSEGHTEAWESATQMKKPRQSVEIRISNPKSHAKA